MRQAVLVQDDGVCAGEHLVVHNVPDSEERAVERARTFQDSFEAAYKQELHTSDGTIHSNYRRELQWQLPQYYQEVLGWKGAIGVARPRELKFRRIELPPPASSSGDSSGDGDVRPLREPSPARAGRGMGAAGEGAAEETPHPRRPRCLRKGPAPPRDNKSSCT